jgi:hypothetical protein
LPSQAALPGPKQSESGSVHRPDEANLIDLRAFHCPFAGRSIPNRRSTTEPLPNIATTHHKSLATNLNPYSTTKAMNGSDKFTCPWSSRFSSDRLSLFQLL